MTNLIKRLKQLNAALPLLLIGIIVWGVLVEFTGVWFVEDKFRYSTGTWIGVGLAVFMAINMALVIDTAVTKGQSVKILRIKSIFRYLIVVIVFLFMVYFNVGNWISAFIAIIGLKISAYAQPVIIRIFKLDNNHDKEVKM